MSTWKTAAASCAAAPTSIQVIQATLVDTWASTAAGAFALSENNLYTTDAFRDYLSHLTDDGAVTFTRWGFEPPRESLRLISLAMAALNQLGETQPWRHVIVGRGGSVKGWGAQDTVLVARKPLGQAEIDRAKGLFTAARMEAVYLPGLDVRNQFRDLLLSPNPAEYQRNYTFDITPVTDNRPFFFYTVQPRDLWNFVKTASRESADYKAANKALPLLFGLMAVSLVATALILMLPPLLLGTRLPRHPRRAPLSAVLFVYRHGVHSHRSGADSEIRAVSGTPHLRPDGGDFLAADVERPGQLRQPETAGRR